MGYLIHILILIAIYIILALATDLIVGMGGLLSMASAAFAGIGAYTLAILLTKAGYGFFLSALISILVTALIAIVIGKILFKLKGDYFALGSMGFTVIVVGILLNWQSLTGGPLGIPGITRPNIFGLDLNDNFYFLIFAALIAFLVFLLYRFIDKSSFGRVIKTIREDTYVAKIFGYNVDHYNLAIFTISAVLCGIAGILHASYISFIDPNSFSTMVSISILTAIILGGLSSEKGAVVGVIFLILLPEFLRFVGFPNDIAANMRQIIYGLVLILMMLYNPKGVFGKYRM